MAEVSPTFYVIHGEDEFNRKAHIKAMQDKMNDPAGLNITVLDGSRVSALEAIHTVSSLPFLSEQRLVIVEKMLDHLTKRGKAGESELHVLVENLPNLPDFARLVFHEETTISSKNPVLKLVKESPRGYEKAVNLPNDPVKWIINQAKKTYNAEIDQAAAFALASVIDKDIRAADNELAKLAAYVNGERPITEADVALLTTYVSEPNIFAMVDAIGQQNGQTAIQICNELLTDQSALSLFGMINRQFRLLILAREYLDQQGSTGGLAEAIGVHGFVGKKLAEQARQFTSIQQLETIYHTLAQYDFDIKIGRVPEDMALQLFIAGVTK